MARQDVKIGGKPYTEFGSDKAARRAALDYFASQNPHVGDWSDYKALEQHNVLESEDKSAVKRKADQLISRARNFEAQREQRLTQRKQKQKSRGASVQRRAFFEDDQSGPTMTTGG